MKVEKVMFVNARGFKEYAVRFRKSPFHRWKWVKDEKGNNKVSNFAEADAIEHKIKEEK